MTKQEFKKRLFLADIDLAHAECTRMMGKMSDAELLAIIESGSKDNCGINFSQMTDRELEAVVYGSTKTRNEILQKHFKRRI